MVSDTLRYSLLCAGELIVVLAGMASIPVAVNLQVLIPLVIFYDRVLDFPVPFIAVFAIGTIVFAAILVFFRHALIPLILLAAFACLAYFAFILANSRIQRKFGGTA